MLETEPDGEPHICGRLEPEPLEKKNREPEPLLYRLLEYKKQKEIVHSLGKIVSFLHNYLTFFIFSCSFTSVNFRVRNVSSNLTNSQEPEPDPDPQGVACY